MLNRITGIIKGNIFCIIKTALIFEIISLYIGKIQRNIGMDAIRAEETTFNIHKIHPNKPEMIFGLASTLALKGNADEAIEQIERGLPLSIDEKQRAATRAALCFLYVRAGYQKYTSWRGKCMR